MKYLEEMEALSKYAGERFDLVQAGGGNTSVKSSDGTMYIKASGFLLSEVTKKKGYALVDNKKVVGVLNNPDLLSIAEKRKRDSRASSLIEETLISDGYPRPSIETFLHSLLNQYTLHTHPLAVNAITFRNDWDEVLNSLFSDALLVQYKTPGIELAIELKTSLEIYTQKFNIIPEVIFLQNHGLIVSCNNVDDVYVKTEQVLSKIETFLNIDLSRYKTSNKISKLLNSSKYQEKKITYLSEDSLLQKALIGHKRLFFTSPFCPDQLVFNGVRAIEIDSLTDLKQVTDFERNNHELPKVIIYNNMLFFSAADLKKAKQMEDVYKFHILSQIISSSGTVNYLDKEELLYLGNWEAEKYRQSI